MILDDVMAELHEKYPDAVSQPPGRLSTIDVERWSRAIGHTTSDLYDQIAARLACGFHTSELTFTFCDAVVNEIHAMIRLRGEGPSDLLWKVFLAFDSGEFSHDGNRDQDPVETYTRPEIARIVAELNAHTPSRDSG